MWKIFTLVVVAFASFQFGDSLICLSCDSVESCRSPSSQTCSNEAANNSSQILKRIHSNVPDIMFSSYFFCANLTYYYAIGNSQISAFLGCVHPEVDVCELTLNATNSNNWSKKCLVCNTYDYCNPAGTFSGSLYTIIASVFALLLAKLAH